MSNDLEKFISGARYMPALPTQISRMFSTLDNPRRSASDLERIIAADTTLSAKLLKLANSVFYSRLEPVTSITAALVRLGQKTVKSLILTVWTQTLKRFAQREEELAFITEMLTHGSACGATAGLLMQRRNPILDEDAFVAGLLHDIGRMVLICQPGLQYQASILNRAVSERRSIVDIETEQLGFHHAMLGGRLMESWHLPALYIDTTRQHHEPSPPPFEQEPILCAVMLADHLVTTMGYNVADDAFRPDRANLIPFFRLDDLPSFQQQCQERIEALRQTLEEI